ncbi:MAG: adenylate/guanylate cyclase domain-containing protein [Chloroflexi bacterium]|nr:adenylate/guanylate cyclase domain-containing protein [Chloroflexota bacterium]
MPHINYVPDECEVELSGDDETILRASLRSSIPHTHVCGGQARCSTCRVMILNGLRHCNPRNEKERAMAERLHFAPNIRLACQTTLTGDIKLRRLVLDRQDIEVTSQLRERAIPSRIGEEKKIAILFSDIRGFTPFAESLVPYDVVHVLNRYFTYMGHVISRHGGMINNYMGDGLMALFGLESEEDGAALQAVTAGLEMLQAMEEFKPYLDAVYHRTFEMGVGVHYGEAVVGALGASDSQRMTAVGDAVNLANRIETANKEAGTHMLISEDTYRAVQERVTVRQRIPVQVRGKTGEYILYEVVSLAEPHAHEGEAPPPPLRQAQDAADDRPE